MESCELSNFAGRFLSNFFLSSPIRDVQSILPIPFPSPSFFSHTENVMPQLFITCVRWLKWQPLGSPLFFEKSSRSSHSMASSIRLPTRTSVILRRRWSSSRTNMRWRGMFKKGWLMQQNSHEVACSLNLPKWTPLGVCCKSLLACTCPIWNRNDRFPCFHRINRAAFYTLRRNRFCIDHAKLYDYLVLTIQKFSTVVWAKFYWYLFENTLPLIFVDLTPQTSIDGGCSWPATS